MLLVDVDHFLTPLVLKVDIDIGRLVAFLRDEPLKQQVDARRVDFRDLETVTDRAVAAEPRPWQKSARS